MSLCVSRAMTRSWMPRAFTASAASPVAAAFCGGAGGGGGCCARSTGTMVVAANAAAAVQAKARDVIGTPEGAILLHLIVPHPSAELPPSREQLVDQSGGLFQESALELRDR